MDATSRDMSFDRVLSRFVMDLAALSRNATMPDSSEVVDEAVDSFL
jgi:hypothetical protein